MQRRPPTGAEVPLSDQHSSPVEDEGKLERELRQGRKFSAQEAVARLAGPGAMKGASPVSPLEQAKAEIGSWLGRNLDDDCGVLRVVLHRQLNASELLLLHLEKPLNAVAGYCRRALASDHLLKELVREADALWGERMDERPYFEKEGCAPHPDDPYTMESVRSILREALNRLPADPES